MKRTASSLLLSAFFLLAGALASQAAVDTKLVLDHKLFVKHAPVELKLTIRNKSRNVFNFQETGEARARLELRVLDSRGQRVERTKEPLIDDLLIVVPQETIERTFDLSKLFKIQEINNYSVEARFHIAGRSFKSEQAYFQTIDGFPMEKMRTLDPAREFALLRADRREGQYLFLAIRSIAKPGSQTIYGVYELGRMVQIKQPQMETDQRGNLHILHSRSPDRYIHTLFTASGRPVDQTMHIAGVGRVSLETAAGGSVRVAGARLVTPRE